MRSAIFTSLLIFGMLSTDALARQVQKWVDENGQVHYGDYTDEYKSKGIKVPDSGYRRPTATSESSRKEARQKLLDSMTEDRKKKNEAKAKANKDLALAKKNCSTARSNLNTLKAGGRILRYNDKGEPQYLDDAQRQREMSNAQKHVDKWCK